MTVPVTKLPTASEQTDDRATQAMQATVRRAQGVLNSRGSPPNLSAPVTFTAGGTQRLDHRLARVPTEWDAVDVTGGYGVFLRVAWDDKTITIQSANACTAVFRFA